MTQSPADKAWAYLRYAIETAEKKHGLFLIGSVKKIWDIPYLETYIITLASQRWDASIKLKISETELEAVRTWAVFNPRLEGLIDAFAEKRQAQLDREYGNGGGAQGIRPKTT